MDIETQKHFENLFSMFSTDGWQILMNTVEDNIRNIDQVTPIDKLENLFFAKGQLDVLYTLKNYQSSIELAFEDANEDTE